MTFLEALKAARETALRYTADSIDSFDVAKGDVNHRLNPESTMHLNSTGAWVVGPQSKSTVGAKFIAEYLTLLVKYAEEVLMRNE